MDHYFIPVSKDHGWYLPGAPPECKHIIDVSGQEPSTVTQVSRAPRASTNIMPSLEFTLTSRKTDRVDVAAEIHVWVLVTGDLITFRVMP